jgi:hypothetical protein
MSLCGQKEGSALAMGDKIKKKCKLGFPKIGDGSQTWWFLPVIPATQEV